MESDGKDDHTPMKIMRKYIHTHKFWHRQKWKPVQTAHAGFVNRTKNRYINITLLFQVWVKMFCVPEHTHDVKKLKKETIIKKTNCKKSTFILF